MKKYTLWILMLGINVHANGTSAVSQTSSRAEETMTSDELYEHFKLEKKDMENSFGEMMKEKENFFQEKRDKINNSFEEKKKAMKTPSKLKDLQHIHNQKQKDLNNIIDQKKKALKNIIDQKKKALKDLNHRYDQRKNQRKKIFQEMEFPSENLRLNSPEVLEKIYNIIDEENQKLIEITSPIKEKYKKSSENEEKLLQQVGLLKQKNNTRTWEENLLYVKVLLDGANEGEIKHTLDKTLKEITERNEQKLRALQEIQNQYFSPILEKVDPKVFPDVKQALHSLFDQWWEQWFSTSVSGHYYKDYPEKQGEGITDYNGFKNYLNSEKRDAIKNDWKKFADSAVSQFEEKIFPKSFVKIPPVKPVREESPLQNSTSEVDKTENTVKNSLQNPEQITDTAPVKKDVERAISGVGEKIEDAAKHNKKILVGAGIGLGLGAYALAKLWNTRGEGFPSPHQHLPDTHPPAAKHTP